MSTASTGMTVVRAEERLDRAVTCLLSPVTVRVENGTCRRAPPQHGPGRSTSRRSRRRPRSPVPHLLRAVRGLARHHRRLEQRDVHRGSVGTHASRAHRRVAPGARPCTMAAVIDLRSDTVTRPTPGCGTRSRMPPSATSRCARIRASTSYRSGSRRCWARSRPCSCRPRRWRTRSRSSCTGAPGDVLVAEEHSHIVIYEFGGAAVHAGLLTVGLPARRGESRPPRCGCDHDRGGCGRPASCRTRDREHPQRRRGPRVAARRARRRRRGRPRRRSRGAPRRRAAAERGRCARCRACGDRRAGRHGHGVPLEGARLSARLAARRPGRADGGRVAPEVPLRRRHAPGRDDRGRQRCTPSTTTSSDSPSTTSGLAAWRRAGTRPAFPSSSTASRRTSSRSTRHGWIWRAARCSHCSGRRESRSRRPTATLTSAPSRISISTMPISRRPRARPGALDVRARPGRRRRGPRTRRGCGASVWRSPATKNAPRRRRRRRSGSEPRAATTPPQSMTDASERRALRSRPCGSRAQAGRSATRAARRPGSGTSPPAPTRRARSRPRA